MTLRTMLTLLLLSASSLLSWGQEQNIDDFLGNFEKAVKAHDSNAIMDLMDPAYKKEQHDEFLSGRTEQFLNEFFCGSNENDGFKCPGLAAVKKLKRIGVEEYENAYSVQYFIIVKGAKLKAQWMVKKSTTGNGTRLGLEGAFG